MNKRERVFVIGGIALIVVAAAVASVVTWALTKGGGGGGGKQSAAISIIRRTPATQQSQGQGPPPEVAKDVQDILDAKNRVGKDHLPGVPPGQQAPRVDQNPPQTCNPSLEPNAFAEWRNTPQNLHAAGAMADSTIVGTVMAAEAGQPYTADAPGEPGGTVETPVQNVTIQVTQSVKGASKAGQTVTVQRLGDAQGCVRVAGDPPYARGQQVLLLLENGAGGRPPHPLSSAGRYAIGPDNAVLAMADNPIASEVAGQKLDQVLAKVRGQ